jgi:heme exporter protein C
MLWPLLTLAAATHAYFFASVLARSRTALLTLESGKDWVRTLALSLPAAATAESADV